MITYAVGDIHGCLDELVQLVLRCQDYHSENHPNEKMKFVFVGDYIDRGPDSRGVIDYLIDFSSFQDCVFLRGNHEDMFMHDIGLCMMNGGYQTMMSYGWSSYDGSPEAWAKDNFPKDHWDFFRDTKLWWKDDLRTYVHAGIDRSIIDRGMDYQRPNFMLWAREEFLYDRGTEGGFVVHGHTPIGVENLPNRCNVDSGCVFGGRMSAAVFTDEKPEPVHFITSDAHVKEMKGPL